MPIKRKTTALILKEYEATHPINHPPPAQNKVNYLFDVTAYFDPYDRLVYDAVNLRIKVCLQQLRKHWTSLAV
jgi:hypothetical protein